MYDEKDRNLMLEGAKKAGKWTWIKWVRPICITVISIILVIGIGVGYIYYNAQEKLKAEYQAQIDELERKLADQIAIYEEAMTEVDIAVVNSNLQKIGELATMEYLYTDVGRYSNTKKILGLNVPGSTKTILSKWDGVIKAGIDMNEVTSDLDRVNKKIIVYIPEAQILSHEFVTGSFETLEEKDGFMNEIKVDDVRTLDETSKVRMEERAIKNGLLEKAYENAKLVINRVMLGNTVIAKDYTIEFVKKTAA